LRKTANYVARLPFDIPEARSGQVQFSNNAVEVRMRSILLTVGCLFVLLSVAVAEQNYKLVTEIPIGGEGGWDILSIDSASHRLYLSHATKVVVVDLEKNAVVGEIADTPGVHAFIAVPELNRGFSSNGKENKSSVVDLATLKTIAKVDTGEGPDAMAYEPKSGEVYIFNHRGKSVTVIEAKSAKVVSTIELGGSPEFGVADSKAGRVYCNLEDKNEVVAIDTAKHAVVARWSLAPGQEPTGIALDAAHHRLFAACNNKMMVMLNTETGKVVATVPIGSGTDGCTFDEKTQLAFASCGEGVTTIAKEETPEKLTVVQTLKTEPRARTMELDPRTHRIYLPSAQFQPAPSPSPGASPGRPTIVPNTLKLLVYGPAESAKE
jgi:YVTN family beta-propeller protein